MTGSQSAAEQKSTPGEISQRAFCLMKDEM
jgi:hypothetical protein